MIIIEGKLRNYLLLHVIDLGSRCSAPLSSLLRYEWN
jgi:hypothetical protein